MSGSSRSRRTELRAARSQRHYAERAARRPGDPNARVSAAVDHLRALIKKLPAEQARHTADLADRAIRAVISTSQNTKPGRLR